jgi:hypothetical protein
MQSGAKSLCLFPVDLVGIDNLAPCSELYVDVAQEVTQERHMSGITIVWLPTSCVSLVGWGTLLVNCRACPAISTEADTENCSANSNTDSFPTVCTNCDAEFGADTPGSASDSRA